MKKDKIVYVSILIIGILIGIIIQNGVNILYSKNLKNSLDVNIKISQGENFIQINNQSNLPENAIIDYDGSISKKINQTK